METMNKYFIKKEEVEVKTRDHKKIVPGVVSTYKEDHFPKAIKEFSSLSEALEALKKK